MWKFGQHSKLESRRKSGKMTAVAIATSSAKYPAIGEQWAWKVMTPRLKTWIGDRASAIADFLNAVGSRKRLVQQFQEFFPREGLQISSGMDHYFAHLCTLVIWQWALDIGKEKDRLRFSKLSNGPCNTGQDLFKEWGKGNQELVADLRSIAQRPAVSWAIQNMWYIISLRPPRGTTFIARMTKNCSLPEVSKDSYAFWTHALNLDPAELSRLRVVEAPVKSARREPDNDLNDCALLQKPSKIPRIDQQQFAGEKDDLDTYNMEHDTSPFRLSVEDLMDIGDFLSGEDLNPELRIKLEALKDEYRNRIVQMQKRVEHMSSCRSLVRWVEEERQDEFDANNRCRKAIKQFLERGVRTLGLVDAKNDRVEEFENLVSPVHVKFFVELLGKDLFTQALHLTTIMDRVHALFRYEIIWAHKEDFNEIVKELKVATNDGRDFWEHLIKPNGFKKHLKPSISSNLRTLVLFLKHHRNEEIFGEILSDPTDRPNIMDLHRPLISKRVLDLIDFNLNKIRDPGARNRVERFVNKWRGNLHSAFSEAV